MRCNLPKINFPCFGRNETSGSTESGNNADQAPRLASDTNVPSSTTASVPLRRYVPNTGRHRSEALRAALPSSSNSIGTGPTAAAHAHQGALPLSDLEAGPALENAFVETKTAGTNAGPLHSTAEGSHAGSAAFLPGDERLTTIEGRLEAGREVLQNVRSIYKNTEFKASNKLRARFDPAKESARAKKAYAETEKVFNQCMDLSKATALATDAQGHNCYTLSLLALDSLKKWVFEVVWCRRQRMLALQWGLFQKGALSRPTCSSGQKK
jgi:hypothetical protein